MKVPSEGKFAAAKGRGDGQLIDIVGRMGRRCC